MEYALFWLRARCSYRNNVRTHWRNLFPTTNKKLKLHFFKCLQKRVQLRLIFFRKMGKYLVHYTYWTAVSNSLLLRGHQSIKTLDIQLWGCLLSEMYYMLFSLKYFFPCGGSQALCITTIGVPSPVSLPWNGCIGTQNILRLRPECCLNHGTKLKP